MKEFLGGKRFGSDEELENAVTTWLNELAVEVYDMGILKLMDRYDKRLNIRAYFLKMDACPRNSLSSSAWQATGPGIAKNLRDALELASDASVMCVEQAPKKLTTEAVYMTFVLLAFVVFALIGSSIDAYEKFLKAPTKKKLSDVPKKRPLIGVPSSKDEKLLAETSVWTKNCKLFLSCFSVLRNGKSLLSTVSKEQHLNCLDGIRAIGLILVILGHTFGFYITILKNTQENLLESLNTNAYAKGILAVDAFFLLSGVLNGYTVSCQYDEDNRKISWLSFPLRRFIKLTPMQLIVVGFYTTLFSYLGSGPVWPNYDTNPVCKEYWIWNLMYLNNFLPHQQQVIHSARL
ncbi:Nose resistant to fluoxetine protein 6 [Araneus ventricosus]|uniref:Nose resistant to fluoxetine protein 6 n=1 Tax=Araneus ventricosus TaxID=182803 RepID=A0A4Y2RIC8_ARAVE|nr:Nose resistant to fluoxetine protein 6 [Araneus ventricosus]